jgi:hypothetical protein
VLVDEKKGKRKEKGHAMNMLSSKLRFDAGLMRFDNFLCLFTILIISCVYLPFY